MVMNMGEHGWKESPDQVEDFVWLTSILAQSAVTRLRAGQSVRSEPFGRPLFRWRLCFEPIFNEEASPIPEGIMVLLRRASEHGYRIPFWASLFTAMKGKEGSYDLEAILPVSMHSKKRTRVVLGSFPFPADVTEAMFRVLLHYVPAGCHVGPQPNGSITLRDYWPWKYGIALAEKECGYSISVQDGTFLQGASKAEQVRMMELTVLCNLRKEYVVPALVMADVLGLPRLKEVAIMFGAFHGFRHTITAPRPPLEHLGLLDAEMKSNPALKNLTRWRYPLMNLVLYCALDQNPQVDPTAKEAREAEKAAKGADTAPAMNLGPESNLNDNISHDHIVLPAISE